MAIESKVGRVRLSDSLRMQIKPYALPLESRTVAKVRWHFSRRPVTGGVGPTPRVLDLLQKNGFEVVIENRVLVPR